MNHVTDRTDCLCAGIVVVDHVCAPIDTIPDPGSLAETPSLTLTIGGCASNVAVGLPRLGLTASVAGTIGDDALGRFIHDELVTAGVCCSNLETRSDVATSATQVINVRGEDRRFIHATAANRYFTAESITDDVLDSISLLYLGGYCLADEPSAQRVEELFARARQRDVVTMLDVVVPGPGEWDSRISPVLPVTDLFVPNEDEARLLSGIDQPLKQAMHFHDLGAATVIITRGDKGAILVNHQGGWEAATHDVPVVDATGGGDAFASGYIFGLLRGEPVEQCLRLATAAGACCVQSPGATTGMPDATQLQTLARETPLAISRIGPIPEVAGP